MKIAITALVLVVMLQCSTADNPGGECWSAYNCVDDGATSCDACGGDNWLCCSATHTG